MWHICTRTSASVLLPERTNELADSTNPSLRVSAGREQDIGEHRVPRIPVDKRIRVSRLYAAESGTRCVPTDERRWRVWQRAFAFSGPAQRHGKYGQDDQRDHHRHWPTIGYASQRCACPDHADHGRAKPGADHGCPIPSSMARPNMAFEPMRG